MKREAVSVIFLLCSLAFCCQPSRAGVTFLSPAHKPMDKVKPPRVGRQVMELAPPLHDSRGAVATGCSQRPLLPSDPVTQLSPPQQGAAVLEVGLSLQEEQEEEFEVYRALHRLLENLLGAPDTTD